MQGFETVVRINKKRNKQAIDFVSITGNCCWRTCDRRAGICDDFAPGEEKSPRGLFISKITAFDC